MQISSKNIFVTLAISFLVFFTYWGFDSKLFDGVKVDVFSINKGENGDQFDAVKREVLGGLKFLPTQSLWDIDIAKMIGEIKRNVWVDDVQLTRFFPNHLNVGLTLKKVSAVYVDDAGIWMPVSGDGTLLNKISKNPIPDLPYLRGRRFYHDKALRKQAIDFINLLSGTSNLLPSLVSEIYFDAKNGFEILLAKPNIRIIFGSADFELKIKRVGKVLEYIEANDVSGRVIDARYEKKILVRLKSSKP